MITKICTATLTVSMELDDHALLQHWRQGDVHAGDALFQRYYDPIFRFFRNKVGAEYLKDLVQQTFIGCVEGRERINGNKGFRPYLFGTARNVLRNYLKSKYRLATEEDIDQQSVADLADGPWTLFARREEHRLLLEGLRAIPVDAQLILELRYWEQFKTVEIAEILTIPHGTARSRLRRAQEQLQQALARLAASDRILESTMANLNEWANECRERLGDVPLSE